MWNTLVITALICWLGLTGCQPEQAVVKRSQMLMGTLVIVTAVAADEETAQRAAAAGLAEIRRLEELLSTWIPSSEVSRVTAAAGSDPVQVSPETLAVDVISAVGPGGHFLAQKHTRKHMRTAMKPSVTHQIGADGTYRDPLEVAREKVAWILDNYQPEPLEEAKKAELVRILQAADRELNP